jgi:hypothetical protein
VPSKRKWWQGKLAGNKQPKASPRKKAPVARWAQTCLHPETTSPPPGRAPHAPAPPASAPATSQLSDSPDVQPQEKEEEPIKEQAEAAKGAAEQPASGAPNQAPAATPQLSPRTPDSAHEGEVAALRTSLNRLLVDAPEEDVAAAPASQLPGSRPGSAGSQLPASFDNTPVRPSPRRAASPSQAHLLHLPYALCHTLLCLPAACNSSLYASTQDMHALLAGAGCSGRPSAPGGAAGAQAHAHGVRQRFIAAPWRSLPAQPAPQQRQQQQQHPLEGTGC